MKSTKPLLIAATIASAFAAQSFAADQYQYKSPTSAATSAEAAQKGAGGTGPGPYGAAKSGPVPGDSPASNSGYVGASTTTGGTGPASNTTSKAVDAQIRTGAPDGQGQDTGPDRGYNAQVPGNSQSMDRDAATRAQRGAGGSGPGSLGSAHSNSPSPGQGAPLGTSNTVRGSTGSTTTYSSGTSGTYVAPSGSATMRNGVTTTVVPSDYRPSTDSAIEAQQRNDSLGGRR